MSEEGRARVVGKLLAGELGQIKGIEGFKRQETYNQVGSIVTYTLDVKGEEQPLDVTINVDYDGSYVAIRVGGTYFAGKTVGGTYIEVPFEKPLDVAGLSVASSPHYTTTLDALRPDLEGLVKRVDGALAMLSEMYETGYSFRLEYTGSGLDIHYENNALLELTDSNGRLHIPVSGVVKKVGIFDNLEGNGAFKHVAFKHVELDAVEAEAVKKAVTNEYKCMRNDYNFVLNHMNLTVTKDGGIKISAQLDAGQSEISEYTKHTLSYSAEEVEVLGGIGGVLKDAAEKQVAFVKDIADIYRHLTEAYNEGNVNYQNPAFAKEFGAIQNVEQEHNGEAFGLTLSTDLKTAIKEYEKGAPEAKQQGNFLALAISRAENMHNLNNVRDAAPAPDVSTVLGA